MLETAKKVIESAISELFSEEIEPQVSVPEEQFGDVATNVAMQLAGRLEKNPREIAEQLAEKIRENDNIANVEIAGPGFINIRLQDDFLLALAHKDLEAFLHGQKVLADYSDPNPFKPLHAGHLYTTLVGDVITRLIERAGAETVRLNYGGDVGLHVAKSLWAIVRVLDGEQPEKLHEIAEEQRSGWLGERYVEGNDAYEDDESAKAEIVELNKRVYQLHLDNDRESPFAQIYWTTRQWSYDYFTQLYEQLQVHAFERFIPESEVAPLGLKTVQEQLEKGVFERSDGAVIFDGEKYGLHKRVFINSEGLPTYEAKDVGLSLTKWQDYHFDRSIIITANEQSQYMQVVIKAIEQFAPEPAQKTQHLTHGIVKLAGGMKMSSRKGNIVSALDILDSAREAGEKSGTATDESTVLAAVKYAFMKNRIGGDIIYDPSESIALEGNSGPYLQYAHARARSILRKASASGTKIEDVEAGERTLIRKIAEYPEIVDKAAAELAPHHICTYLYELAQTFNHFYEHNRVIGDERESVRLNLISMYAETLKKGLALLGITAPEQM